MPAVVAARTLRQRQRPQPRRNQGWGQRAGLLGRLFNRRAKAATGAEVRAFGFEDRVDFGRTYLPIGQLTWI
jgi:hypothetical protein